MKYRLAFLLFVVFFLLSCKTITASPATMPAPTKIATRTRPRFPTSTPAPIIEFLPTEDLEQMESGGFRMPIGEPVESWNGVPIMPGAIAGDSDEYLYYFTIDASIADIQAYYKRELKRSGARSCYADNIIGRTFAPLACVFSGNPLKSVYIDIYPRNLIMLVVVDVELRRW